MCDDTQYLHYLSPTEESGRMHDKKVADEYPLHLPAGSVLRQDLGLPGHTARRGWSSKCRTRSPPKGN